MQQVHVLKPFSFQVLKAKDINGDGSINFQEYLGSRGEGKDKEWLLSEKDRYFMNLKTLKKEKKAFKKYWRRNLL